jgi:hypothetical protein
MNNNNNLSAILLIEKMSKSPNKIIIQMIQQLLDGKPLSFQDFISTGMFIPRNHDLVKPLTMLKENCKDIVMYMGGFYVQVLTTEDGDELKYLWEFFDNDESDEIHTKICSPFLKEIEKVMWELQINKYFNL